MWVFTGMVQVGTARPGTASPRCTGGMRVHWLLLWMWMLWLLLLLLLLIRCFFGQERLRNSRPRSRCRRHRRRHGPTACSCGASLHLHGTCPIRPTSWETAVWRRRLISGRTRHAWSRHGNGCRPVTHTDTAATRREERHRLCVWVGMGGWRRVHTLWWILSGRMVLPDIDTDGCVGGAGGRPRGHHRRRWEWEWGARADLAGVLVRIHLVVVVIGLKVAATGDLNVHG